MARKPRPKKPRKKTAHRRLLIPAGIILTVLSAVLAVGVGVPFWQLSSGFGDFEHRQPSRLYGRSTLLRAGATGSPDAIVRELEEEGYREAAGDGAPAVGRYRRSGGKLTVHLRRFPSPEGRRGPEILEILFRGRRIASLERAGENVESADLEPPLLASYYGDDGRERRPVDVDEVPEELIDAVLAAEDARFFDHPGLSLSAILRAAWVNLRGGEVRQGGSTLTQQLVKNLYLSHDRTLGRKLQEAVLAMMLDLRYEKRQILQAYLNEIYLGTSNGVNLIGVGAAARALFSKEIEALDLAEAATLAGMIPSPGRFSPLHHPEAAKQRRDWVLERMVEAGRLDENRRAQAAARPVQASPAPVVRRRAPYFAAAAAVEAERRFGIAELEDRGYVLLSTLSAGAQKQARSAVAWGVDALERGWQKGAKVEGPLQAALVSVDPATGGLLAYVGGRDFGRSQFDRAGQARRQVGSAFKPVVFATAFELGVASPSTFLEDAPLIVRLAGRQWSPSNSDGDYRGWVTARTAVEESLNTATARLALATGLDAIVDTARDLGIRGPMEPFPSLALGAVEVTPLEMAAAYATFAAGGVRPPVHGLQAVFDGYGRRLPGAPLPAPERELSAEGAYLVTSILQGVIEHGTGAGVRRQGLSDPLAGKTGTSNRRRDSWFAGYSPDRATAVWVGYDDNAPTRMGGARAALPIWARFTAGVRPAGGYRNFEAPPGIVTAAIDPVSGKLATDACPTLLTEVFRQGSVPSEICDLHFGYYDLPLDGPETIGYRSLRPKKQNFKSWLRQVFADGG